MVGEIGGSEEEKAAAYIGEHMTDAGDRVHRRLHRSAGQDDGPRGRDHLRLGRDGARRRRKPSRPSGRPRRDEPDRGRRSSSPKPSARSRLAVTRSSGHGRHLLRARHSRARPAPGRGVRRVRARRGSQRIGRGRSTTGRPPAIRRCATGSPGRHDVDPGARRAHDRLAPGLQLRRAPLRRGGRDRLRRGALLRPLARHPARHRRAHRLDSAPRGRARRGRARRSRSSRRPAPKLDLHDPDLPEPERAHALRGEPRPPARAREARPARRSSRTIPYGLLRFDGEPLPTLFESRRRRGRALPQLLLEDDRARDPRRVRDPPRGARRRDRAAGARELRLAVDLRAGRARRVRRAGDLRAEPRADARRPAHPAGRDARGARAGGARGACAGTEPEGGYFLWLDFPTGVDAASCSTRATEADVTFVKGSDFYLGPGGEESARLAFSFATAEEIDEGIARLAGPRARRRRRHCLA